MAAKIFEIQGVGPVALYKRKGVRTVRMSITHEGTVRVTIPAWAPYKLGVEFAKTRADWINKQKTETIVVQDGDRIGKAHRVRITLGPSAKKPTARISGTNILVTIPATMPVGSVAAQDQIAKAAIRALKKESQQLLPQRLKYLADQHGFTYNQVGIKRLTSRWGSCNQDKDIVLNCYLMQLPWHLIDYVLLHELTHTKIMRHGHVFWHELGKYVKDLPQKRKEIKSYKPALTAFKDGDQSTTQTQKQPIKVQIS